MEAAVYDIASRQLLFRAPGVSTIDGHSTPINSEGQLRADSAKSYVAAAQDLSINLQTELDAFKVRAREEPEAIKIEHKPGYSGMGSVAPWFGALHAALIAGRALQLSR